MLHARGDASVKTFILSLYDTTRSETIGDVVSFIGEDSSGSFGILANRRPLLTVLTLGMCRFLTLNESWHYIALPGGILSFGGNNLSIATRHYLRSDDYTELGSRLESELDAEERGRQSISALLRRVEHELLSHLLDRP